MVPKRETASYKCSGTPCGEECYSRFHEKQTNILHPYPDGQYNSSFVSFKNGGYQRPKFNQDKRGNLELLDIRRDHDYCRTSSREIKYESRLAISLQQGFLRVETVTTNIQPSLYEAGFPRDFCFPPFSSAAPLLCVASGHTQFGNRCHGQQTLCIS